MSYTDPILTTHPDEFDADVNATNSHGATALFEAVRWKRTDIIDLLLENNADPNVQIREGAGKGFTPLLVAVFTNNTESVIQLLRAGANPNPILSSGPDTILSTAVKNDNFDIFAHLLEHNANIVNQEHPDHSILPLINLGPSDAINA